MYGFSYSFRSGNPHNSTCILLFLLKAGKGKKVKFCLLNIYIGAIMWSNNLGMLYKTKYGGYTSNFVFRRYRIGTETAEPQSGIAYHVYLVPKRTGFIYNFFRYNFIQQKQYHDISKA